jgi:hypothetical protein
LEQQGWSIHRIWSTEWMRHPDHELQRVIAHIQALLDGNGSPTPSGRGDTWGAAPVDIASEPPPVVSQPDQAPDQPITVQYRTTSFPCPDADMWETSLAQIAQAVIECVQVEGPIHQELLLRRIATLWGYQRAGSRIAGHVGEATAFAIRRGQIRQEGVFLWPAGAIEVVPRGLAEDGTGRAIEHVPDEEIEQVIVAVLEGALSLTPDELVTRSARTFGFQRTGRDIRERILAVMETMISAGLIQSRSDRVQVGRVKDSRGGQSSNVLPMTFPPVGSGSDWYAENV